MSEPHASSLALQGPPVPVHICSTPSKVMPIYCQHYGQRLTERNCNGNANANTRIDENPQRNIDREFMTSGF